MNDQEAKLFLQQIRNVSKNETQNNTKNCVKIIPAYVISVSGQMAKVRLVSDTNGENPFTVPIITSQSVNSGDYVNLAYWDNLSTAVIFSGGNNYPICPNIPIRPNLLINGGLRVWQRFPDGYTGVPDRIYIPDRFEIQSVYGGRQSNIVKANDYGGIYNQSGPSFVIRYYMENAEAMNGKTLTLSVLRQPSGEPITIVSNTITASGWSESTDIFDQFGSRLFGVIAGEKDFYYKLEEGEGQTLGYQDSTGVWHQFPQPDDDYQTQLAKCKYFFNRYNYVQGTLMGFGFANSATELGLVFKIPPMRTNPAITVSSFSNIKISQGALSAGISPTGISSSFIDGEGNVNIAFSVSGGLTPGAVYRVGLSGGYIQFNSEL